jgi:predicted methyltransferase
MSMMPSGSSPDLLLRRLLAVFWCAIPMAALQDTPPINAGNPSTIEDFKAGDAHREPYQKATDLLAAMNVSRGDWVADVGAGAGYYSMRLAHMVGPEGKVFAEDISDSAMRWLNARMKVFDLRNVEIVKGEIDDPKLPADGLTAVLIVDSYHHLANYQAMLKSILHALKPGGRLVIADYSFTEHRTQPRADQLKLHEIDPELVRGEVGQAGFEIVKCDDPFVKWGPGVGNSRSSATDMWLMVAVRPK